MIIVAEHQNYTYKSLGDQLRDKGPNNFTIFSWTISLSKEMGILERKYIIYLST